jgi:TrmH family RNA methyltransferase
MGALRSRDNPRVRRWHALAHDGRARRGEGCALIEGAHLVSASLAAGVRARALLVSESGRRDAEIAGLLCPGGVEPVLLEDALFRWVVDVASPAGIAAEIEIPRPVRDAGEGDCVFLEAIQDAGNVGAILRSAAAFGVRDAVLGSGCADPWSPKVLRAAMGAHFALRIRGTEDLGAAVADFGGTTVCAVAHGGRAIAEFELGERVGWILGAEGQGVSAALAARAAQRASIALAAGTESLNVAAAAAILFYERMRRRSAGAPPVPATGGAGGASGAAAPPAPNRRGARS